MMKAIMTSLMFVRSKAATREVKPVGRELEPSACTLQCSPDTEILSLYPAMSTSDVVNLGGGYATVLGFAKDADVEGFCYPTVKTKYLNAVESVDKMWEAKAFSKKDVIAYLGRSRLVPQNLVRVVQKAQNIIFSPFLKYSRTMKTFSGKDGIPSAAATKLAYVTARSICSPRSEMTKSVMSKSVGDSQLKTLKSAGQGISLFEKFAWMEYKAVNTALVKLERFCTSRPLAQLTCRRPSGGRV